MSGKTLKDVAAEKFSDVIVVQGITINDVKPEVLDDFEIMEALAVMSDASSEAGDIVRAMTTIAPVLFGAKQWKRIKAELREQNGGKLPNLVAMGFIEDAMAALKAKNS